MKTLSIVGARPQFVKLAVVSRAMRDAARDGGGAIDDVIVHTGQHYDAGMSDVFFEELKIPRPSIQLGVGSGGHGEQTAKMLAGLEAAMLEEKPDIVVIYGDTNSTVAGALAAAKLHIPVAHVEAGLRSFDRRMPEEINRIMSDHVSDLLFAPTATAVKNLADENLSDRTQRTGDVMLDAVRFYIDSSSDDADILNALGLSAGEFAVGTIHRASNTEASVLPSLLDTLESAAERLPLVLPMHPRTTAAIREHCPNWRAPESITIIEPLGYIDMIRLLAGARVALTDSGGLQKEAFFVDTPCVTLRDTTEWLETVSAGGNIVTGIEGKAVLDAVDTWLANDGSRLASATNVEDKPFGDGRAGREIVGGLLSMMGP